MNRDEYFSMFVKFKADVLRVLIFCFKLLFFLIHFLFLGYIYSHVCVSYQLNVRSTMEIGRSRQCEYFLVVLFYNIFSVQDHVL